MDKRPNTKVIAIIQARMGATRLPGKVLEDIAGEPMLARVVNRVRRSRSVDDAVIATTTQPADEAIISLCQERSWSFFRGSENDVLDRYYHAASAFRADAVVRVTSDCPLIDPEVIDEVLGEFLSHHPKVEYVSNVLIRTFPRGLDVEAMAFDTLEKAWREGSNPSWREHVTPYIWRHPEKFRICNVANDTDYSYMRWCVDTSEDLAFVRKVYDCFQNDAFTWRQVLRLLEKHPEWLEINQHVRQKAVP